MRTNGEVDSIKHCEKRLRIRDLRIRFWGLAIKHLKAHNFVWQGYFFFHNYLATIQRPIELKFSQILTIHLLQWKLLLVTRNMTRVDSQTPTHHKDRDPQLNIQFNVSTVVVFWLKKCSSRPTISSCVPKVLFIESQLGQTTHGICRYTLAESTSHDLEE